MIKEIINELAYDKITLTQALTRAKLVAFTIDNQTFQSWLKWELEGYNDNKELLPEYRKVPCVPMAKIGDRYGRKNTVMIRLNQTLEIMEMLSVANVYISVPSLETNFATIQSDICTQEFAPALTELLRGPFEASNPQIKLLSAGQEFNKLYLKNIIDMTKQKLIDTLLELNKEFPNLTDDFKMDKEKNTKIENIITTNIYGSNNPLNITAGEHVQQSGFTFNTAVDFTQLEKLGVQGKEVEELQTIIAENKDNPSGKLASVMKWLGGVSASIAARGLYEKIPAITEFVHTHILK
ncbi:hypothetical protein SAMN05428975_3152 [Mucilaginibacter sp. OK268]|uniref:AbiTii domain-containing protein n=1 Tax=Mucilaginibacter sp. OK268 TaxID=1881048 RepID=UPI000881DBBB|nr:hypothetical protein [Mucilaginibacter sp. OK268]SDP86677.1 hypothetical protein SAMN05428975_3152 [Mucilaginibacter sp. OK268]